MQPTRAQIHIDRPLTDMAIAFTQNAGDFIAGRALPVRAVSKQTDKYFIYNKQAFFRDDAKLRGPGDTSGRTGFRLSNDSYYCEKWSLGVELSYDDIANADEPLDLEGDALQVVMNGLMIRREKLFAEACFAASIWTTTVDGAATAKWDDYMASDPIRAVDNANKAMRQLSGKQGNKLILGIDVFNALKEHPDLVDRIKYTSNDVVQEQLIAKYLGVDEVMVARALADTNGDGSSTASLDFIASSKGALLLYAPASVGPRGLSGAVQFGWSGAPHLPRPNGVVARRLDIDEKLTRVIEADMTVDFKVTAADCGVFFTNIVG
jgi:hypothetical protein